MVNPILATIIKKAMTEGFNNQKGGGDDTKDGNDTPNKERKPVLFLFIILVVIILLIIGAESIVKEITKDYDLGENTSKDNTNEDNTDKNNNIQIEEGFSESPQSTTSPSKSQKDLNDYKKVVYYAYSGTIILNIMILLISYFVFKLSFKGKDDKKSDSNSVKFLFMVSFIIMFTCIIISYMFKIYKSKKKLYFYNYIGIPGFGKKFDSKIEGFDFTAKEFTLGMITNIIFGFIDNFGLFFGMDSIDEFLNYDKNTTNKKRLGNLINNKKGDVKTIDTKEKKERIECLYNNPNDLSVLKTAGWGNTFSDFLGAFVGNAIGDISLTLADVEKTPIISEILGIVIGCVIGIYVPAYLKKLQLKNNKDCNYKYNDDDDDDDSQTSDN